MTIDIGMIVMNEQEFKDYCNEHAGRIAVRETVDGKLGWYWLSELSQEVKNSHIDLFWRENRMPCRVKTEKEMQDEVWSLNANQS